MKTRLRKAQWKSQATREAVKALSKAKTVIKNLLLENSVGLESQTPSENLEQ